MSLAETKTNVDFSDKIQVADELGLQIFPDTTQDFYPDHDKAFERIHDHSIWRDVVEIGDHPESAREYSVVTALPNYQLVDTPILITTAFLTSTHGHNEHTMLHLLELGFPVIMIGPEGEAHTQKSIRQQICNAKNMSLPLTTQNAMTAFEATSHVHNSQSFQTFDDTNIIVLGESRGAMIGVGLPAYAHLSGHNVIYADLTAPCFPTKFDHGLKGMREMGRQALAESSAIKGLAKTLVGRRLMHYPSTLNLSPQYLLQAPFTAAQLINGEAGDLAKASNRLNFIPMHITGFNDDTMCQFSNWKEMLGRDHPEISFMPVDGAHLSLAAPETLQHIERRLSNLRDEIIKNNGDVSQIDYFNVHLRDRQYLDTLASLVVNNS